MSAGKPGELHPSRVARDIGLTVHGGRLEWPELADAAFWAYWLKRSEPVTDDRRPWWNFPHHRPRRRAA